MVCSEDMARNSGYFLAGFWGGVQKNQGRGDSLCFWRMGMRLWQ